MILRLFTALVILTCYFPGLIEEEAHAVSIDDALLDTLQEEAINSVLEERKPAYLEQVIGPALEQVVQEFGEKSASELRARSLEENWTDHQLRENLIRHAGAFFITFHAFNQAARTDACDAVWDIHKDALEDASYDSAGAAATTATYTAVCGSTIAINARWDIAVDHAFYAFQNSALSSAKARASAALEQGVGKGITNPSLISKIVFLNAEMAALLHYVKFSLQLGPDDTEGGLLERSYKAAWTKLELEWFPLKVAYPDEFPFGTLANWDSYVNARFRNNRYIKAPNGSIPDASMLFKPWLNEIRKLVEWIESIPTEES